MACLVTLWVVAGCASRPVGVKKVGTARAYRQIYANALSEGRPSDDSIQVLHRYDLERDFQLAPAETLKKLHALACLEPRRDTLFALAELSYLVAESTRLAPLFPSGAGQRGSQRLTAETAPAGPEARDYYLSSAICAYLFLFGEAGEAPPTAYDWRFRIACDLYNRGLAAGFKKPEADDLWVRPRTLRTACGDLSLDISPVGVIGRTNFYARFLAADDYAVRGLTARNRRPGLGVPIIAVPALRPGIPDTPFGFLPSRARVPATAFLRVSGQVCDLAAGSLKCSLEVYSPFETSAITVEGQPVPLENDLTVALAYSLEESPFWAAEIKQFFSGLQRVKTGTYLTQPYHPGRVPVVFVHGTASSPARWAEMLNTLQADAVLRERCQFWYFIYNTCNPLPYSAALLRTSLEEMVRVMDPSGRDPALRQMVVLGHSQGGLIARMMALESGTNFYRHLALKPLEQLRLSDQDRQIFCDCVSFQPMPCVRRVVYLATPHRGSYRINNFVLRLAKRFVRLPGTLVELGRNLTEANPEALPPALRGRLPNSVDQMRPESPLLAALLERPLAPGVKSHSIIAVEEGPLREGTDGVVAYSSAHLDETDSELVVRSGHSCQDHPLAIQEVRRILLNHVAETSPSP